jgi:methyl-accepting chemotaxis protein
MFKFRTISARLVLAISLIIALTCGILGEFSILQQRSLMRLALDQQLTLDFESITAAIDYEGRAARTVSIALAALPPVADAFAKADRDTLASLLGGTQKELQGQGVPFITLHLPTGIVLLRVHDPKSFGDDVSERRPTVVAANKTGTPIGGIEIGRGDSISVVATTPIMRAGKSLGDIDVGVPLGKPFVDRAKQRLGVDLAVRVFDGSSFKTLASTIGDGAVATAPEWASAFGGTALRRDATYDGHSVAVYVGQLKNYAGKPVAVIELIKDTTEYEAQASSARFNLILVTVVILTVGILLALVLGRGLSRPLSAITATMNSLSGGDTSVSIPGSDRQDELGTMAKAVDVFRRNMIETNRLSELRATEQEVKNARATALMSLTMNFEARMSTLVRTLSSSSGELRSTAGTMAETAERTTRQASTVALASEQATANAHAVASATEELSASIREIAEQVTRSSSLIQEAVTQANQSNELVGGLTDAAERVGDVVRMISDIAGQTNLLALNATIEAARAGESGRGFAVVASEVKALANQTAKATEQIGVQIKAIQEASRTSARSIQGITETIGRVNETAVTIASTVEEQDAATREIAQSVQHAAEATRQVTNNIASVSDAANETGAVAAKVLTAAGTLSRNGESLQQQLDDFLRDVRAA